MMELGKVKIFEADFLGAENLNRRVLIQEGYASWRHQQSILGWLYWALWITTATVALAIIQLPLSPFLLSTACALPAVIGTVLLACVCLILYVIVIIKSLNTHP